MNGLSEKRGHFCFAERGRNSCEGPWENCPLEHFNPSISNLRRALPEFLSTSLWVSSMFSEKAKSWGGLIPLLFSKRIRV